jgi:hypothetical protein
MQAKRAGTNCTCHCEVLCSKLGWYTGYSEVFQVVVPKLRRWLIAGFLRRRRHKFSSRSYHTLLWWTMWYWGAHFLLVLRFPLPITIPPTTPHSSSSSSSSSGAGTIGLIVANVRNILSLILHHETEKSTKKKVSCPRNRPWRPIGL